jgi:hypothetical protein
MELVAPIQHKTRSQGKIRRPSKARCGARARQCKGMCGNQVREGMAPSQVKGKRGAQKEQAKARHSGEAKDFAAQGKPREGASPMQ